MPTAAAASPATAPSASSPSVRAAPGARGASPGVAGHRAAWSSEIRRLRPGIGARVLAPARRYRGLAWKPEDPSMRLLALALTLCLLSLAAAARHARDARRPRATRATTGAAPRTQCTSRSTAAARGSGPGGARRPLPRRHRRSARRDVPGARGGPADGRARGGRHAPAGASRRHARPAQQRARATPSPALLEMELQFDGRAVVPARSRVYGKISEIRVRPAASRSS